MTGQVGCGRAACASPARDRYVLRVGPAAGARRDGTPDLAPGRSPPGNKATAVASDRSVLSDIPRRRAPPAPVLRGPSRALTAVRTGHHTPGALPLALPITRSPHDEPDDHLCLVHRGDP